ncbi:MAG TPA: MAPEG family protein [Hyphomicrobium sp.]|nr:MAPEG family protein [Hyphomicrobium sp.]
MSSGVDAATRSGVRSSANEGLDMPVAITASYTGILALIIVVMGISVTIRRFGYGAVVGDGGRDILGRIIRIHGNLVENIPLYEFSRGETMVLQPACTALNVGRVLFAGPLWFHDGPSPILASGDPHMGYCRFTSNAKHSAVAFIARVQA